MIRKTAASPQVKPPANTSLTQNITADFDKTLADALQSGNAVAESAPVTGTLTVDPPPMPFRPNPQLALAGLSLAGRRGSRLQSHLPLQARTPTGAAAGASPTPAHLTPVSFRLPDRGMTNGHITGPVQPQAGALTKVRATESRWPGTASLALTSYPKPAADNGRGVHWIPTTRQSAEVVDEFVGRAKALNVRWVTLLNEAGDLNGNDYLVKRLTEAGIMPVMRIYSEGSGPIPGDLKALVGHYRSLGVSYYQLYNEPNLADENGGGAPNAERYAANWVAAARQVVEAGGLPGLAPLSPQGTVDDLAYLRASLRAIKAHGGSDVLQRAWLSVHNYGRDHLRVRQYDAILRETVGRSLPQIGTEAGIYQCAPGPDGGGVSEQDQIQVVSEAFGYLAQREPYYFAYSLWCIANQAGGGHDPRWEAHALYRTDGPTALAMVLEAN